jgi:hypothetical protein
MPFSALLSLLFLAPIAVQAQAIVVPMEQPQLNPVLKRICGCESSGSPTAEPRQFNEDGTLLKGKNHPADWGSCQLNSNVWLDVSDKLGYDIRTTDGNIMMANYIYEKYGTTPWKSSTSCWSKR